MTMIEKIKELLAMAMKERSPNVGILRVVLGEFQRNMKDPNDDNCYKIIKKIIEANEELLKLDRIGIDRKNLQNEIDVLKSLLPEEMNSNEMYSRLSEVVSQIHDAKSDGQAIGIAMKCLRKAGKTLNADLVSQITMNLKY